MSVASKLQHMNEIATIPPDWSFEYPVLKLWVKTCLKLILPQKNAFHSKLQRAVAKIIHSHSWCCSCSCMCVLFHFMFFRAYLFAFISTQFQKLFVFCIAEFCCFIESDLVFAKPLGNPGTSLQICQCQHYRVEQIVVITVQVLFGKPEIDSARFQPHLVSPFDLPSSAVLYKMTCKSQSRSRSHIFFANGWTDHFCLKKTQACLAKFIDHAKRRILMCMITLYKYVFMIV